MSRWAEVKCLPLGKSVSTEFFAHFIIPGQSDGLFSSVFQNCHLYCLIFSFFFTVTHAHYRKLKNTEKSIKNKGLKKKITYGLRLQANALALWCISIQYFFIFSFFLFMEL